MTSCGSGPIGILAMNRLDIASTMASVWSPLEVASKATLGVASAASAHSVIASPHANSAATKQESCLDIGGPRGGHRRQIVGSRPIHRKSGMSIADTAEPLLPNEEQKE